MNGNTDRTPPSPTSPWASPWLFFCLVFCWSWAFWTAAAALGISVRSSSGEALEFVGLLGPMLGGIAFTYLTRDRQGRREYWARIVDPRRIPPVWYLVIFLFAPAFWAATALLDLAFGERAVMVLIGERVAPLLSAPSTILPFVLWTVMFGPIPEELGWRGYALDRLQERWTALASSLILGAVWALYHLPLFYMKGTFHYEQGVWSAWFWLFMVQVIASAVMFTWIFNNTRRSTLGAILFHFMLNLTVQLANVTPAMNFYSTLLWVAAAVAVASVWGPATLSGPRPSRF